MFLPEGAHISRFVGMALSRADEPEIGDVDEGVVEGGEDTSNAEDEFTCENGGARQSLHCCDHEDEGIALPSRT